MKILSKIYCWLKGHDMVAEGVFNNDSSAWGSYRCLRCDKIHNWQYDN